MQRFSPHNHTENFIIEGREGNDMMRFCPHTHTEMSNFRLL